NGDGRPGDGRRVAWPALDRRRIRFADPRLCLCRPLEDARGLSSQRGNLDLPCAGCDRPWIGRDVVRPPAGDAACARRACGDRRHRTAQSRLRGAAPAPGLRARGAIPRGRPEIRTVDRCRLLAALPARGRRLAFRGRGGCNAGMNARLLVVLAAAAMLAACAHQPPRSPIAEWVPSPNYDVRRPNLIVIHATEEGSAEQALDTLRIANSGGPVSAHYLIGKDGTIYQLVADAHRAWQAGAGAWGAINELNSASIGIELDNDGETPFEPALIDSLIRLLDDLCTRLNIPRDAIIAHADLAPARKRDPGFRFPWKQ